MGPVLRRVIAKFRRRVHRRKLLQEAKDTMSPPTPDVLRGCGDMFEGWPNEVLESFVQTLYPIVFEAGNYMCHQGDPSSCLYILTSGSVSVIVRDGTKCVRPFGRLRRNAPLSAPELPGVRAACCSQLWGCCLQPKGRWERPF